MEKDIEFYRNLLTSYRFDILEKELFKYSFKEIRGILYTLAYSNQEDGNNLLVYTFLMQIISKNQSWQLHLIASEIMGHALNHIQSAEEVGLYHGIRAMQLNESDIDIKEYLLYFNHIPKKVLDDKTAIEIAKEIIKERPQSLAAKMTLSKAV